MQPTVLVLSHGHPAIRPGGGENAAYALHGALLRQGAWNSVFLAAAPAEHFQEGEDLRPCSAADTAGSEWLVKASSDWLTYQSACSLLNGSPLHQLVFDLQPQVISVHQIMHLGLDLILRLRDWCPQARIVYTLHEFLLLCPFNGQLKTREGLYCKGPTPLGCRQCLPEISSELLLLRSARIQLMIDQVDCFISPSRVVKDCFVAWGIAAERIEVIANCLADLQPEPPSLVRDESALHSVFGFFGNCSEAKGLDLVLEAMLGLVRRQGEARLVVHGPVQRLLEEGIPRRDPYAIKLQHLLGQLGDHVSCPGPYRQEEIPRLMRRVGWVLMASRWLENAPVVIQESLACRRPLLVPALGGMAEHVRNGLDGLHFSPDSSASLQEVMERSCRQPQLWADLQRSLAAPLSIDVALKSHFEVFEGA
ncbi:glycosyltransferase [Synechococcus sp. AH-736-M02]|nr:glycosyltransferase [Synechococcus sp. AH-736-M02]